jgi:uncharacterized protein YkwD
MTLTPGIGQAVTFRPSPRRTLSAAVVHTGVFPWQTDGGTRDLEFERQVIAVTNQHRASVGAGPVRQDVGGCLEYSAVGKSYDMARWMYMRHDQPTGGTDPFVRPFPATTVVDRFVESGYSTMAAWGENIAYGKQNAADVTEAFLGDIGHRQNVEGPWAWMGVGVVRAPNGLYFVTEDFGTEHDPVAGAPPPPDPTPPPASADPRPGEQWRKKAAHRFVVEVDRVGKAGAGKRVYAHHPGSAPESLDWALSTFRRNFERVPA